MRAYNVLSRRVNAGTADGYSDWDDGIIYYADNTTEAEELYIDDITDEFDYDVRKYCINEFGNIVDYQLYSGEQFQVMAVEPDLDELTEEELAELFKAKFETNNEFDEELCKELIRRAGMWDEYGTIEEQWADVKNREDFEIVLSQAADILGIDIY